MALQARSFRPLALAGVAADAIFGAAWWGRLPRQTAERFLGHLAAAQVEAAAATVVEPSALRGDSERLVVRTADGREFAVPLRGATMAALEASDQPARAGPWSYLLAERAFAFAILCPSPVDGRVVHEVLCRARRGGVELTATR
ncbi:MAG: hypothetical protein FJ306_09375 [Planctomycetes bacterium]|nr:hypothetical protein [Planctomycetota bacterium]